jgi:hypothetical protein
MLRLLRVPSYHGGTAETRTGGSLRTLPPCHTRIGMARFQFSTIGFHTGRGDILRVTIVPRIGPLRARRFMAWRTGFTDSPGKPPSWFDAREGHLLPEGPHLPAQVGGHRDHQDRDRACDRGGFS